MGKEYYVKEYWEFPYKDQEKDTIVKKCKSFNEALFEQKWLASRAKMGEKYYVIDVEHKWKELTKSQKSMLKERFGIE